MIDAEGLNELEADLARAPRVVQWQMPPVVKRLADAVTSDAARLISGLRHAPHYPASITNDVEVRGTTIEAEIGPDKGRTQGALGNILEYGTSKNAPLAHLGPALDLSGPDFERLVGEIGERAL